MNTFFLPVAQTAKELFLSESGSVKQTAGLPVAWAAGSLTAVALSLASPAVAQSCDGLKHTINLGTNYTEAQCEYQVGLFYANACYSTCYGDSHWDYDQNHLCTAWIICGL
jgi:hypothetical protein